jgi:mRNA-degrading endonuclease toxin of MazEF toxin-antitoxin module
MKHNPQSPSTSSLTPQRGEVWLVNIPNQPKDPHQPRTAIIISTDARNRHLSDVIVVPTCSSIVNTHPKIHTYLPKGEGGLALDCYARCEQITTVDKSLLQKGPLGAAISDKYLRNIVRCIRQSVGDSGIW